MTSSKEYFIEGLHWEWGERYEIEKILNPQFLAIVRDSSNPKATLGTMFRINGEHPGETDGLWIEESTTLANYCGRLMPELCIVAKPHTGWY